MTSLTIDTKYKRHHTPLNEIPPMKIFCVRHWLHQNFMSDRYTEVHKVLQADSAQL